MLFYIVGSGAFRSLSSSLLRAVLVFTFMSGRSRFHMVRAMCDLYGSGTYFQIAIGGFVAPVMGGYLKAILRSYLNFFNNEEFYLCFIR